MFTGIVEEAGRVEAVRTGVGGGRLQVAASFAARLAPGQSVAVDGACLTVRARDDETFSADLSAATLERTIAARYVRGALVNLERAATIGDRLDGHLVQGHVDAQARLETARQQGNTRFLEFRLPPDALADMVPRGSVALNGVSLTVNRLGESDLCEVAVVPRTWEHTNLSALRPGDAVNLETDLIGKYVRRAIEARCPSSEPGGHGV